jgi:DNA polymerase-3 subunit delta
MIAALAMKLRAMVKVAAAGRGRDADVARAAGMAPWQVERARADLRGWTPEGIATSLVALAEADAAAKGLSRDPVYAVERAVLVVTSARS